eukprot:1152516-Pelagomonas_calceolata.AAC.2
MGLSFHVSQTVTERHSVASRILLKGVRKSPLGAGLVSMSIGSADLLASQNLQIPKHYNRYDSP